MKMIVVPIVFACMVVGIAGNGDGKSLGWIGTKILLYFFSVTTTAIVVGLVIGNLLQPGAGTDLASLKAVDVSIAQGATSHSFARVLINIIPDNIVDAIG